MESISGHIAELKGAWSSALETLNSSPAENWQPHLQSLTPVMLDEVVRTALWWLDRVRSPTGFAPVFSTARALALLNIAALIKSANQISAAQYSYLPTFVAQLISVLTAIHTLVAFSQKDEITAGSAEVRAEVGQALALIATAQRELEHKAKLLEQVGTLADEIRKKHDSVQTRGAEIEVLLTQATDSASGAENANEATQQSAEAAKVLENDAAKIVKDSETLRNQLTELLNGARKIQEQSLAQQEVINSILPKGASAGLAAAFATRGRELNSTKWIWMAAFVVSLACLAVLAYQLLGLYTPGEAYWTSVLYRIPLAAPLVWLGWFSAIQYGNIVRVQEDYAFKEATSKAFQGYRDHMQHLAEVDAKDAGSAMNLLAVSTIGILASEPLRIYGRSHEDASPTGTIGSLLEKINFRKVTGGE